MNAKDGYRRTPIERAISGSHKEVVELLISKGADISPLHLAAYQGDLTKVKTLIEKESDINLGDKEGFTLLHAAAVGGRKEVVEILLAKGANVNTRNRNGWTPLHYATREGHREVAELLISKGANVNAKGWRGLDSPTLCTLGRIHGCR